MENEGKPRSFLLDFFKDTINHKLKVHKEVWTYIRLFP